MATVIAACTIPLDVDLSTSPVHEHIKRQDTTAVPLPVSKGNRYEGAKEVPRGLGSQPNGTVISSAMNIEEMQSALEALVTEFGIRTFEAPEKTWENRTVFGAVVSSGDSDKIRALFTGGMHARERAIPDSLIYFIADLLWADREGTGLQYGGVVFTAQEVKRALDAGIIIMPALNPDGIAYDQATNECWRNNRNPDGSVNLNRNFDWLWDFEKGFAPGTGAAESEPGGINYHGTAPFSEPESRNIRWVFDTYPDLGWTIDVHSYATLVLYGWADDILQTTDPSMNFMNPAYDGKRGNLIDNDNATRYRSYMPASIFKTQSFVASQLANTMNAAVDFVEASMVSEPTGNYGWVSGCMMNYAMARHWIDAEKTPVNSFTVELASVSEERIKSCPFYLSEMNFNLYIKAGGAAYMQFLLAAADENFVAERVGDEVRQFKK